jgi:hypothetical protein
VTALRRTLVGLALLGVAACRAPGRPEPTTPTDPEAAARSVFDLAREGEPTPQAVDALFGPVVDELERATLLDALDALGPTDQARIVDRQAEPGEGAIVFDVVAALHGGGEAGFSVGVVAVGEGWRVRWFHGPGVQWPRARPPAGEGLSALPPG